jgi:hypothetical protein
MRPGRVAVAVLTLVAVVVVVAFALWPRHSRMRLDGVQIVGAAARDRTPGAPEVERPEDAAVRYVLATRDLMAHGPIGRREVLRHLMTVDGYARAVGTIDATIDDLETRLRDTQGVSVSAASLTWVEAPLTEHCETVAPTAARCVVWSLSVFGARQLDAVHAAWRTVTIELRIDGTRWLVEGAEAVAGPAPSTAPVAGASDFDEFARVATAAPVVGTAR